MTGPSGLRRLWGTAYQLSDLLDQSPGGPELAARDFALLTLAGQLSFGFPRQLVFKGGFVLRHVHGILRFSQDVDATRHEPARHKLDALEVADTIRQASIGDINTTDLDDDLRLFDLVAGSRREEQRGQGAPRAGPAGWPATSRRCSARPFLPSTSTTPATGPTPPPAGYVPAASNSRSRAKPGSRAT